MYQGDTRSSFLRQVVFPNENGGNFRRTFPITGFEGSRDFRLELLIEKSVEFYGNVREKSQPPFRCLDLHRDKPRHRLITARDNDFLAPFHGCNQTGKLSLSLVDCYLHDFNLAMRANFVNCSRVWLALYPFC